MKKFILILLALLILAAGGVFIYVVTIDWNKHKDAIAEQFYNSTGKNIVFEGNVGFNIFPTPYLNAVSAKVYDSKNKDKTPLLDVKNVNVELALMPLLGGEINITKMVLDGVIINIDWDDEGLNWQGDLSADQRQLMQDSKMALSNVSFKDALLNFRASNGDISFTLANLHGEVMAQNIFGPFRIEGNYLKNGVPQGFAITIGKMTDSMATTLNAVFTHPKSDSYIRFDGSFHTQNRVLNGNVVIESQSFSDFFNDNVESVKLSDNYKKPLVAGFDLALNKQMINLNNMVLKYDESQGAGSFKMTNGNFLSPNMAVNFEFADLKLDYFVDYIKEFIAKYSETPFTKGNKVKLEGNIKAIRTSYAGQNFKNMDVSFGINEKGLMLDNLRLVLPGDTEFNLKGNVYSYNDEVYYQAETSINTENLMQMLRWLDVQPKTTVSSVYKKMLLTAKVMGNLDSVHLSPFKLVVDNTTMRGDAGMSFGERKDLALTVETDTLNLDNYISSLPEEIKNKSFIDRMNYRFFKLGVLNDFDITLKANAGLLIYGGIPFEKVVFDGSLLQGNLEVEKLEVESVASTKLAFSGNVKGFGQKPIFESWQYNISTQDLANMVQKFGLAKADINYGQFYNFNTAGTLNGTLNDFAITTDISSGDVTAKYEGMVVVDEDVILDGDLELKHPEFLKLLSALKIDYVPQSSTLGMFMLKSKVKGRADNISLSSSDINIGYNRLNGYINYNVSGNKKIVEADLKVSKLDVEKYLVRQNNKLQGGANLNIEETAFLSKPVWSKDKIDYTPYTKLDVKAKLDIDEMSYKTLQFNDAKFSLRVVDGVANVQDFSAVYHNTPIKAAVILTMVNDPSVNVVMDILDANVSDFSLGGKVYAIKNGQFSTKINLDSKADSEDSFIEHLNGTVEFIANNSSVSGVNIPAIYDDITTREKSEGLIEKSNSAIANGSTDFDKIVGKLAIKDGAFNITECNMRATNLNVDVLGGGSIKDWTINTLFSVKHDEPQYLPGYSISMKNSISNPDVSIDVSKLFNVYKSKEDQIMAEKKAAEEFERQLLSQRAIEQKKIAEDLIKSTQKKLKTDIEEKNKTAFNEESMRQYNNLNDELTVVLNGFLDKVASFDNEDISQKNIDVLKELNDETLKKIEVIKNNVNNIYISDLQKENAVEYDKVVQANNESKQIIEAYNSKVADYTAKLSSIITEYKLYKDQAYMSAKEDIDNEIAKLEQINSELITFRDLYQENATADEYKQLNVEIKSTLEKIVSGNNVLNEKVKMLDSLVGDKISKEVEAYNNKIIEEENERLIRENTGSISIKKTGKKVTVRRNLDDIRDAEKEISNEIVKVIDFTRKNTDKENANFNASTGVIKKGRAKR